LVSPYYDPHVAIMTWWRQSTKMRSTQRMQ
jgi:hypothetical protein